jgi:hypothetical protein
MGMTIPQVVDLEEFAAINKEHNKHLSNHFGADSDAKYVRLRGRNRIYYNFIKIRAIDDFEVPRIYAEILNEDYEKKLNSYKNFDSSGPGQGIPAFSNEAPTFGMTPAILNAAGSAFDIPAIIKAEDLLNPTDEDDSFEVPF